MKTHLSDLILPEVTRGEVGLIDTNKVKGSFNVNGVEKTFIVPFENHMNELYILLVKYIRKEKIRKL